MNRIKRCFSLIGSLILSLLFPFFAIYGDAPIKGKAIDSSSSNPLENVRILLVEVNSGKVIDEAMTDTRGGYEFKQVASGKYQLRAEFEGYVVASMHPVGVNVENQVIRTNFSLGVPGSVEGLVIDDFTGLPIANANVDVMRGNSIIVSVLTDDEGYYRIDDLAPRPFIFRVRMVDFQSSMELVVPLSNQIITNDFSLKFPPGKLRGRVVDFLNNQPISNAIVDIFEEGSVIDSVETNEEGRYFFSEISPGFYEVKIRAKLYGSLMQEIAFSANQEILLNFVLEPKGVVEGQVVHKFTGEPIVGAAVGIWQNGELCDSTSTDEDGCYSLYGLKDFMLVIQAPNFYEKKQSVFIQSAEVTILNVNLLSREPASPRAANVITVYKHFAHQVHRLNYVKWIRSLDPSVVAYHIYCDGKKVGVVSSRDSFVFKHRWTKGREKQYQVVAVNSYGQESLPVDAIYVDN